MASQLAPLPSTRAQPPGIASSATVSVGIGGCLAVAANAPQHGAPVEEEAEEVIEDDIVEESIDEDVFERDGELSISGSGMSGSGGAGAFSREPTIVSASFMLAGMSLVPETCRA